MIGTHRKLSSEEIFGLEILFDRTPLVDLATEFRGAKEKEARLSAVKKFIVRTLPAENSALLGFRDAEILEIFEQSLKNMIQTQATKKIDELSFRRKVIATLKVEEEIEEYLRPKTWIERTPILNQGMEAVKRGFTYLSALPAEDSEKNEALICLEAEDDWSEIMTEEAQEERLISVYTKWQEKPALLIETETGRGSVEFVRRFLSEKKTAI